MINSMNPLDLIFTFFTQNNGNLKMVTSTMLNDQQNIKCIDEKFITCG